MAGKTEVEGNMKNANAVTVDDVRKDMRILLQWFGKNEKWNGKSNHAVYLASWLAAVGKNYHFLTLADAKEALTGVLPQEWGQELLSALNSLDCEPSRFRNDSDTLAGTMTAEKVTESLTKALAKTMNCDFANTLVLDKRLKAFVFSAKTLQKSMPEVEVSSVKHAVMDKVRALIGGGAKKVDDAELGGLSDEAKECIALFADPSEAELALAPKDDDNADKRVQTRRQETLDAISMCVMNAVDHGQSIALHAKRAKGDLEFYDAEEDKGVKITTSLLTAAWGTLYRDADFRMAADNATARSLFEKRCGDKETTVEVEHLRAIGHQALGQFDEKGACTITGEITKAALFGPTALMKYNVPLLKAMSGRSEGLVITAIQKAQGQSDSLKSTGRGGEAPTTEAAAKAVLETAIQVTKTSRAAVAAASAERARQHEHGTSHDQRDRQHDRRPRDAGSVYKETCMVCGKPTGCNTAAHNPGFCDPTDIKCVSCGGKYHHAGIFCKAPVCDLCGKIPEPFYEWSSRKYTRLAWIFEECRCQCETKEGTPAKRRRAVRIRGDRGGPGNQNDRADDDRGNRRTLPPGKHRPAQRYPRADGRGYRGGEPQAIA